MNDSRPASRAIVRWVSGPVLRAQTDGVFAMREAVRVGPQALLGEVVRIDGDEIVVQVYENTTGLRPGIEVAGSGLPLAIRVGPGLLGGIFDGLLRPLGGDATFVQPGMRRALPRTFRFEPRIARGERVDGGAVIGEAIARDRQPQRCLAPPDASGEAIAIAAAGDYADDATVCTIAQADGTRRDIAMAHDWPVRVSRPVRRRLPALTPLVTGQRILDSLFPVAQGGRAAIPGGFGTGKTVLLEALAKGCNADVIVYLGCGERGNEMAGVLDEFPQLVDPRTGRALMERTVVIARRRSIARSRSPNIFATRACTSRSWPTRRRGGPRRCAKCRDASASCPAKAAIRRIFRRGSRISTSARRSASRSRAAPDR